MLAELQGGASGGAADNTRKIIGICLAAQRLDLGDRKLLLFQHGERVLNAQLLPVRSR